MIAVDRRHVLRFWDDGINTHMIEIGDEVVHQSHPGRFEVLKIEPRPSLNVNGRILTIRSNDGVVLRVLDTCVRAVAGKNRQDESSQPD